MIMEGLLLEVSDDNWAIFVWSINTYWDIFQNVGQRGKNKKPGASAFWEIKKDYFIFVNLNIVWKCAN